MSNYYLSNNNINNRRRVFLTSVGSYLELDNEALNFNSNYENSILLMDSEKFITAMFLGITNFIDNDFANRTLLKPYNSQNIEDELSRFSDNTKSDIYSKLMAIKHFLDGREVLQEHNDYFFGDFLNEIDSDKYQQIKNKLEECFSIYNSINGSFDNAINISSPERTKVYALYNAVTSISYSLKEIQAKILN